MRSMFFVSQLPNSRYRGILSSYAKHNLVLWWGRFTFLSYITKHSRKIEFNAKKDLPMLESLKCAKANWQVGVGFLDQNCTSAKYSLLYPQTFFLYLTGVRKESQVLCTIFNQ